MNVAFKPATIGSTMNNKPFTTAKILLIGKLNGTLTDTGEFTPPAPEFKTRVAPTVDVALQFLSPAAFDLVLLDMDVERGREHAALAALHEKAPCTPIICMTDKNQERAVVPLLRSGKVEYLPKAMISPQFLAHIVQHVIERTHSLRKLQSRERRFRKLFEVFPDAVYSTNAEGTFVDFNKALLDLFGYSADELNGMSAQLLFARFEDYDTLLQHLSVQGAVTDYPVRMADKSGKELSCLLTAIPNRTENGTVLGYQGIIRDITQREALEESWRRYEFIVNTSKEFMTLVNRDYVYHAANEAYCRAHGKKREEIVGRSVAQVWGEGRYLTKIKENFDRCFAGDEIHYQGWFTFSVLGRRYMDVTYYPYYNAEGIVTHAVVVSRDITERTRAEKELQRAHAHNQQILTAIPSILINIGADDTVTLWNKPAEASFGIPAEKVVGKPFAECGIRWDWAKIESGVEQCRRERVTVSLNDMKYTHPDGKDGFLNLTISPFIGESDERPGFLLVAQDITERKILESQLSQSQKLESIGQLAAGIAHEINTPTQYVGDNIRFMQDSFNDIAELLAKYRQLLAKAKLDSAFSELIADIEAAEEDADIDFVLEELPSAIRQSLEGVGRVSAIVRAMKEFSHPGVEEKSAVDINRAIESTVTVARNEWKYVADVKTDFAPDLPPVPCFAGEFNQVILNIIVNAAHAIADAVRDRGGKGLITISTRRDGDWVEIRISDTGTGIPETARPRIFDPFFTTKEVGRGTGQGLAISHSVIVEKHKGTISFETEMGKGTTFIIRLPLDPVVAGTNGKGR